ncbi:hypothetical protein N869_00895 [Cellulomonas bogoriensis 69B4 = DSM 16987]|uniref:Uncharacterized protein n=1 Tax=Cellulomonas bogoriensis 69B4 = DSM 16987 TaxID=1386082 RepID=A0A0A0BWY7_9CELL|nr:hypothetical protein N869_00895 [Cellulomonas bogoriensis 69B4 = DSM 16987]
MGDVSARPPLVHDAVDQQLTAAWVEPGISVRHENLRVGVGLQQATARPEVLPSSTTTDVTNVLAEYN